MKGLLVTLVLGLFSFSVCSQTFYSLADECLVLLKSGEQDTFEEKYPRLYPLFIKEVHPDYRQALECVEKRRFSEGIAHLEALVIDGYFIDEILTDPNFKLFSYREKEWSRLIQTVDSLLTKLSPKQALIDELRNIQNKDQGIRFFLQEARHQREDLLVLLKIREVMAEVDRENAEKVCKIVDTYGWLGPDAIGSEGNQTLFLAIQHVNDQLIQEKYLPILQEAVNSGNAEGWQYAFLTDRILMNKGEKQIYGTQKIGTNPSNMYLVPLQDPDQVDELRERLGMSPLSEDLKEEGIRWDIEEYKEMLPHIEELYRQRNESLKEQDS